MLFASLAIGEAPASFRSDIAPILVDHCLACHGAKKAEGGYRVDSFDELIKPGDSGELPIAAEEGEAGELLRRVTAADASERMPAENDALTADQVTLFQRWIAGGAKFDGPQSSAPLNLVIPPRKYADPPESYSRPVPITAAEAVSLATRGALAFPEEITIRSIAGEKFDRIIDAKLTEKPDICLAGKDDDDDEVPF